MKRHLLTLVLSGLVGSLVLAGEAQACHKKKCTCAAAPTCAVYEPAPCPAPAPVCAPAPCAVAVCAPAPCAVAAPCPAPAPVCEPTCCAPKKHCGLFGGFKGFGLGCHRRATCCAQPVAVPCAPCETVAYSAPVYYSAPAVYSSPQVSAQH